MQTKFRTPKLTALPVAASADERRIIPPTDFPVHWPKPEDEQYHWTRDREHNPLPLTPMFLSVVAPCANAGRGRIIERHAENLVGREDRSFNGFNYTRFIPFQGTPQEVAERARRNRRVMTEICSHLEATWENEWKPAVETLWRYWESFDLENADMPVLLEHLDGTFQRTIDMYEIHYLMGPPMWFALDEFKQYCSDLFGTSALDAHRMLQGFDNITLQMGRALWGLSRLARQYPQVEQLIRQSAFVEIRAGLSNVEGGQVFQQALDEFLQAYGNRTDLWDWGYPTWQEDPSPVFASLKAYVLQPDCDMLARLAEAAAAREAAIAEARKKLTGYPLAMREHFETLLLAAQSALVMSENHTYYIDFNGLGWVRRVIKEVGKRLVARGQLYNTTDVFYLKLNDVKAMAVDPSMDLAELALSRRMDLEAWASYPAPAELGTRPLEPLTLYSADARRMAGYCGAWIVDSESPAPCQVDNSPNHICGQSGSAGIVRGRARIILSLSDAHRLEKGDILVTTTTAPPWTPLFLTAGGLVTDAGGLLSHGAVVSREYRIPAVVGTGCATATLKDSQWIEVDGTNGVVHIL